MTQLTNQGVVIQMQDYSIHDGDGVRTTLFLAGCKLRCQWCANPESWTQQQKLVFYRHKCIGCMKCAQACPQKLMPCEMLRPNKKCMVCGACVHVCTQKASVDDVMKKIERDALFFRYTGGGITFSGGEPFLQHNFIRALLVKLEELGIESWVETCGFFDFEAVKDILPKFSHIFLDIKHMDRQKHIHFTGCDNKIILDNAKKIYALGIPITIRIPTMVEVNLDDENLKNTAIFMQEHLPNADIELLPYHELGKAKYISLGMEDKFVAFTTPTQEQMNHGYEIFENHGIQIVEYR